MKQECEDGESPGEMEVDDAGDEEAQSACLPRKVYIPGVSRPLKGSEELVFDKSAYRVYHPFQLPYPCLSFDPVSDGFGDSREAYPLSCTFVAGTQAPRSRDNMIILTRLTNIYGSKAKDTDSTDNSNEESSSSSSSEDDELSDDDDDDDDDRGGSGHRGKKPCMYTAQITHHGGINRIRAARVGMANLCSSWNEEGKVHIWSLAGALRAVETLTDGRKSRMEKLQNEKPLFTFPGHRIEGYAMDWSALKPGRLATGDIRRHIYLWTAKEGSTWSVDQRPYSAHTGSVEDIQWSPNEEDVFASCSSDKTIRLWDVRAAPSEACVVTVKDAHESDVNVLSWNLQDPFLLSGGDEGVLKIWDLRIIQQGCSVARFKHHTKPITTVQWCPSDSTVFAAASEDDQLTIWDLAVEKDDDAPPRDSSSDAGNIAVPPQLLFIHQGQHEMKELRWFTQSPGMLACTAIDGFNLMRTISV